MLKLGTMVTAAFLSVAAVVSPALSFDRDGGHGGEFRGGFHDHDRFRGGFFFGGIGGFYNPFWGFPYYPYAYGYAYPYGYPAAMPYPAAPAATAPNVWYFCHASNAYYPYVQTCSEPWQQVPAQPQ